MRFKDALWDGSDPLYAPCLSFARQYATWKAPKLYVDHGYEPKQISLDMPGARHDEHEAARALKCREYTKDMLRWWEQRSESAKDFGLWSYVIRRYRTDATSPYAEVKQNTRDGYDYLCDRWDGAIGHMPIESMTFETIKKIEQAMKAKGREVGDIHRMMTQLRAISRYGALLSETKDKCREVKMTLSDMRFPNSPPKSSFATREQVEAVVACADAAGFENVATGWLMQFELMLRPVDVRGQWLADGGREKSNFPPCNGGIVRNGRRWQDGLTWDMFDEDLTQFSKVISKTAKSMPEPYTFDLRLVPELRSRLLRMRPQTPVGPLFMSQQGLPYDQTTWARVWARFRKAAGVPDEIKVTDLRASGVTEAKDAGANHFALRDAAQHTDMNTTSRYARGRSEAAGQIIELRQRNKPASG